ncbi:MAG: EamA family transporter RarD [Woeseiaceae bacterium]
MPDIDESVGAEQRIGVMAGLVAYTLWGIFPVYFKLVEAAAPLEVLVHRIVWAVPFGALILYFRRQWPDVRKVFRRTSTLFWLGLAALCISANWLIYVWAIHNGQIFATSLGYFINPLVYVAVGVFAFGERLSRLQFFSVILAAIGVLYLTFIGGVFPWIALSLAALFTAYGVIRKQINIGAMPGLFVETSLLFPLAAGYLAWLGASGQAAIVNGPSSLTALLALAGPVTVLPLWMFAIAARKLTLTTLGFMQFIGPSLQFMAGIYYGEELTSADIVCFAFIWLAIVVFVTDAVTKKPRMARPAGA